MSKIMAIYKRLQEVEMEERSSMPWYTRVWRRYQKPSALVLDQLSKLRAENVLDIIEDALGSALANKQQQKLKVSFMQQQSLNAKTGNAFSNPVAKDNARPSIHSTAGRAPNVQSAAANRVKQALGSQHGQNNASAIRGPSTKQRNSTLSASSSNQDRVGSRTTTPSRQRHHAIELEEVVVHGAIGAAVDNQPSKSTDSSLPPSPPSSPPPSPPRHGMSTASDMPPPTSFIDQRTRAPTVHARAHLTNAGSAIREQSVHRTSYSGGGSSGDLAQPAHTMSLPNRASLRAASSQSPLPNVSKPDLLTAAASAASAGSLSKGIRPITPSRMHSSQSGSVDDGASARSAMRAAGPRVQAAGGRSNLNSPIDTMARPRPNRGANEGVLGKEAAEPSVKSAPNVRRGNERAGQA